MSIRPLLSLVLLCGLSAVALAAPSADEVLAKANAIVAPEKYKATAEMKAQRADKTVKVYVFRTSKDGADKLRLSFDKPSTLSGHEILRLGDDLWRYVPSLKRSMRIASRDDFEAGDFRNADVLRVDLVHDYKITKMTEAGANYVLDLAAKTKQAGYDRIVYTVRKTDFMPQGQEFYASSGKKLRTLKFSNEKLFGKHTRPSKLLMTNELVKGNLTEMTIQEFEVVTSLPSKLFQRDTLGR